MTAQQSSPLSQAATDTAVVPVAELRARLKTARFVHREPGWADDWKIILAHYQRRFHEGAALREAERG